MNTDTFNAYLLQMQKATAATLTTKAAEYATEDRLHNFKIAAPLQGRTAIGALGGMMAKHTISIYDMIGGVDKGQEYPLALWEEKIKDRINYLFLLWALVNDKEPTKAKEVLEDLIKPVDSPTEEAKPAKKRGRRPKAEPQPWPLMDPLNAEFEKAAQEMDSAAESEIQQRRAAAEFKRGVMAEMEAYRARSGPGSIRRIAEASGVSEGILRDILQYRGKVRITIWQDLDKGLKKLQAAEETKNQPRTMVNAGETV